MKCPHDQMLSMVVFIIILIIIDSGKANFIFSLPCIYQYWCVLVIQIRWYIWFYKCFFVYYHLQLTCSVWLTCWWIKEPKLPFDMTCLHVLIWAASWENQHSAYAKTKTQISFAVTAKLISAFVFAIWIVQYLYYLHTKFQASSHLQWLYSLVCVRPGQNPHCWFSRVAAHSIYNSGIYCIL